MWGGEGAHTFHTTVSQLQTQAANTVQSRGRGPRGHESCRLSGETHSCLGSPWLSSQQALAGATFRRL